MEGTKIWLDVVNEMCDSRRSVAVLWTVCEQTERERLWK